MRRLGQERGEREGKGEVIGGGGEVVKGLGKEVGEGVMEQSCV